MTWGGNYRHTTYRGYNLLRTTTTLTFVTDIIRLFICRAVGAEQEQFLNPTDANIESLQTLLAARIREGSGETLFEIGVEGIHLLPEQ